MLDTLAVQMQQLTTTQLTAPVPAATPTPAPSLPGYAPKPHVGIPEHYAGDPENCGPFLANCTLLFYLQPHTFATEDAKVAFTIHHLMRRARLWGIVKWERQTPAPPSRHFLRSSARFLVWSPI